MSLKESVIIVKPIARSIHQTLLLLLVLCLSSLGLPSVPTFADPPAVAAPTNVTLIAKSDTAVSLSWTSSTSSDIMSYEIVSGTTVVAAVYRLSATSSLPTLYAFSGLTPATTYSFAVVARNAAGSASAPSAALTVTTESGSASVNIALGGVATADYQDYDRPAWKAVDGSTAVVSGVRNVWHSANAAGAHWLQLDIGKPRYAKRFVVRHMGATGGAASDNTSDFKIQGSNSTMAWDDLLTVTGNTYNVTDHTVTPVTAYRFYRIYVTDPGHNDDRARISELEIYSDPSLTDPPYTPIDEVNLSQDLVSLGIYSANLTPNQPTVDARPYIEAALQYAKGVGIHKLTVDQGDYYFLSQVAADRHLEIIGAKDLTIDFADSNLYFANGHLIAILLTNCERTTLTRLKADYLQLPSTQLVVSSVNASARTIQYTTMSGFQSPTAFNASSTPYGDPGALRVFVFRGGERVQEVGRLQASRNATSDTITIINDDKPWTQEANLAAIQPGDTLVYTDRSGGHTIKMNGGQGNTISYVEVYAAPVFAFLFHKQFNTIVDHVSVKPRPGSGRLMSSNADGIHFGNARQNNVVQNSFVQGTGDDGIAFNSTWLATVTSQTAARTLSVQRFINEKFPVGTEVEFMDGATGERKGTAVVTEMSPPYGSQTFLANENVTVTFDRDVPTLSAGSGMYATNPNERGYGSKVLNNHIEQTNLARGILFAGIMNGEIRGNTIKKTNMSGINVNQEYLLSTFKAAPANGITIEDNTIEQAFLWGAPASEIVNAGAALLVNSYTPSGWSPGMPHQNIAIRGNTITDSGRTGIRVENTDGGEVSGNTVTRHTLLPEQVYGVRGTAEEIATQWEEIRSGIVIKTSDAEAFDNIVTPAYPATTLLASPVAPDGPGGAYKSPVTLQLATGSQRPTVTSTVYSFDGGATWSAYTGPIVLAADGDYSFSFRSANIAGVTEATHTAAFRLALDPPAGP